MSHIHYAVIRLVDDGWFDTGAVTKIDAAAISPRRLAIPVMLASPNLLVIEPKLNSSRRWIVDKDQQNVNWQVAP